MSGSIHDDPWRPPSDSPVPASGLAILLWSCEPEAPHLLYAPFFHAATAAAFDLPVEVYFTARSVRLLEPGVAERLGTGETGKTVLDAMREAVGHGAMFLACGDALEAHGLADSPLIAECAGRGGSVQFIGRAMDLRWRCLVY